MRQLTESNSKTVNIRLPTEIQSHYLKINRLTPPQLMSYGGYWHGANKILGSFAYLSFV